MPTAHAKNRAVRAIKGVIYFLSWTCTSVYFAVSNKSLLFRAFAPNRLGQKSHTRTPAALPTKKLLMPQVDKATFLPIVF